MGPPRRRRHLPSSYTSFLPPVCASPFPVRAHLFIARPKFHSNPSSLPLLAQSAFSFSSEHVYRECIYIHRHTLYRVTYVYVSNDTSPSLRSHLSFKFIVSNSLCDTVGIIKVYNPLKSHTRALCSPLYTCHFTIRRSRGSRSVTYTEINAIPQ